jgi:hypothetical protein
LGRSVIAIGISAVLIIGVWIMGRLAIGGLRICAAIISRLLGRIAWLLGRLLGRLIAQWRGRVIAIGAGLGCAVIPII